MKAIELNMPDDVYEKLENLASHDHQSVNVFARRKLEVFARAFEDYQHCIKWNADGGKKFNLPA